MTKTAPGTRSRIEAARVLGRWLTRGDFPDRLPADLADRGFVMDLVYRTVRRRRTLDWLAEPFLRRSPEAIVRSLIWIGSCQLFFAPAIPDHAAISATVEATRGLRRQATGYVNAVLRQMQRQRDHLLRKLACQPLGVRVSHPDILINRWLDAFGSGQTEKLCAWNNRPARTVLATLAGRAGADELKRAMERAGVNGLRPHPADPENCLILPRGTAVTALPGFREGDFLVQDPAALVATRLLDARPGMRALDACAAPGGKAAQIAAAIGPGGSLTATDPEQDRLRLLQDNFRRLRLSNTRILQADALTTDPTSLGAPFDRILIDAPCTNTGVLRRRPDARWRFAGHGLRQAASLQGKLLDTLFDALAPGGRLVYATCSLEKEENEDVVEDFLRRREQARLVETASRHPVRHGTDGMFAAAIEMTPGAG